MHITEKNGSSSINIVHKSTVPINEENISPLKSGVRDILMNGRNSYYQYIDCFNLYMIIIIIYFYLQ